jgi:hypothetical protein
MTCIMAVISGIVPMGMAGQPLLPLAVIMGMAVIGIRLGQRGVPGLLCLRGINRAMGNDVHRRRKRHCHGQDHGNGKPHSKQGTPDVHCTEIAKQSLTGN